ncbi:MAG TPA: hypothetical protein PKC39_14640 [Ferruginibacter sp.]|nr:hypothetical protein [Ferruginibacter sp.]HMP22194.1 hypothetical protein [Ferruginibacter sp.]
MNSTYIIHKGITIALNEGFWYIATKPLLPFYSLAAAKLYIDEYLLKNEPGTV